MGRIDERRSTADGQGSEAPLDLAPRDDLARTASRTTVGLGLLVDGEDHLAILIIGAGVLVAADAEGMIQKLVDMLTSWFGVFDTTPIGISMSTFFNPSARFRRMNRFCQR